MRFIILLLTLTALTACKPPNPLAIQSQPQQRGVIGGLPAKPTSPPKTQLSTLQGLGITIADARNGTHIILPADKLFVEFTPPRVVINPNYYDNLNQLAGVLAQYPEVNLEVVGYSDNIMNESQALTQSSLFAYTVTQYLTTAGIHPDRIKSVRGAGSKQPIIESNDYLARQVNRRVEIIALAPLR